MTQITVLAYLKRKSGLSLADFRTYYEDHHIPNIIIPLAKALPLSYTRRYLSPSSTFALPDPMTLDYDVITTLVFKDGAAFQDWMGLLAGDNGLRVVADEENFLDREKTKVMVLESIEEVTTV